MLHVDVRHGRARHFLVVDAYRATMFPMRQAVEDRTFVQITKRILGLCELKAQWRVSQYPAEAAEQAEPAFADFRTPRKCRSPRRYMAVIIDFSRLVGWSERILVRIILHNWQEVRRLAGMMTAEPSRDVGCPGNCPRGTSAQAPGPHADSPRGDQTLVIEL